MPPLSIFAIPVIAVLGCFGAAQGRWGPAGCSSVEGKVTRQVASAYRWVYLDGRKDVAYLYHGNQGIGYYSFNTGFYRRVIGGTYGAPEVCPIVPPFDGAASEERKIYTGFTPQKMALTKRFGFNGKDIAEEEALLIVSSSLRDDSKNPHLTNVDKDPLRRRQADEDFKAATAGRPSASNIRWQNYDPALSPNQAILAPFTLDKNQKYQETGRILLAQTATSLADPATETTAWYGNLGVAEMTEALRKIDPFWDPIKPLLPVFPTIPTIPWEWILGAVVLLALVIFAARANKP